MKKNLSCMLAVLTLCATGAVFAAEQTRTVAGFTSIRSQGAMLVNVEVGAAQSLVLKGNEKFLEKIITEVVGDELRISYKDEAGIKINANLEQDAKISIAVPVLNKYKMEGVGKTTINHLTGAKFDLNYEGVGEVVLNGKVNAFKLRAKGVGGIDAKNLQAQLVDANVEGVGSVKVFASDRLNATMNGIGSLTYFGHPRSVNKNVDGIGNVSAGD